MKITPLRPLGASCALVLAFAWPVAPAQAGLMDFLFGERAARQASADTPAPGSQRREWRIAEFSAIRLVPREPGAPPNAHPVRISPEQLRQALVGVMLAHKGREEPLFHADELAALVTPLSQALAAAGEQDDVILLSTSRRDAGLLGVPYGLTARLFVQEGALQLIVHDARLDFVNAYRGARIVPDFQFGSRTQPGRVVITADAGSGRRADWVSLPLAGPARAATVERPPTVAPAAPPSQGPAPVAPPAAGSAPPARSPQFFEEQEQRLRALKRLRDQGLISEQEHEQKRREILQQL